MADPMFDVAIVGGGLVGNALLLALAESGLRILQIDATQGVAPQAHIASTRHLALNRYSVDVLRALGLDLNFRSESQITQILISRAGEFGRVLLRAADHGLDHLGQLVPSTELAQAFASACANVQRAHSNIQVRRGAALHSLEQQEHTVRFQMKVADTIEHAEATVLVGADGSDSAVRKLGHMQIAANQRVYDECAIAFNFKVDRPQPGLAIERFSREGPVAALPLSKTQYGAVWTLPADRARALCAESADKERASQFQRALGTVLGRVSGLTAPSCWPLQLLHTEPSHQARAVLIGNAAQTIHPLGAQGFNLGLRDAVGLADYLRDGFAGGRFESTQRVDFFQLYAAQRADDRARTRRFSDGLLAATSSTALFTSVIRQVGMAALAHSTLAQRDVIRFGLGYNRATYKSL